MRNVNMEGSLGYSDHVIAELRVLRADRKLKKNSQP